MTTPAAGYVDYVGGGGRESGAGGVGGRPGGGGREGEGERWCCSCFTVSSALTFAVKSRLINIIQPSVPVPFSFSLDCFERKEKRGEKNGKEG